MARQPNFLNFLLLTIAKAFKWHQNFLALLHFSPSENFNFQPFFVIFGHFEGENCATTKILYFSSLPMAKAFKWHQIFRAPSDLKISIFD